MNFRALDGSLHHAIPHNSRKWQACIKTPHHEIRGQCYSNVSDHTVIPDGVIVYVELRASKQIPVEYAKHTSLTFPAILGVLA
jgi:hypothetical protein